jgi:hypothetical protein
MLESLTPQSFSAHIGSRFSVSLGDRGTVALELSEISRRPERPARPGVPRTQPFTLLFLGPLTPVLPQRIYPLQHLAFPGLEVFLVPIGPQGGHMRYEAVFN